jgi:NADP-dependent 3-hydroxy acid dehydrogenase YdfG
MRVTNWIRTEAGENSIALLCGGRSGIDEEANARLLSAAPDMVEALRRAANFIEDVDLEFKAKYLDSDASDVYKIVSDALEKAEGRS